MPLIPFSQAISSLFNRENTVLPINRSNTNNSTSNLLELTTQVYKALEYGESQGWGENSSTSDAELQLSDKEDTFYDVQEEYSDSQSSSRNKTLSDNGYTNQTDSSESTVFHGGKYTSVMSFWTKVVLGGLLGCLISMPVSFIKLVRSKDDKQVLFWERMGIGAISGVPLALISGNWLHIRKQDTEDFSNMRFFLNLLVIFVFYPVSQVLCILCVPNLLNLCKKILCNTNEAVTKEENDTKVEISTCSSQSSISETESKCLKQNEKYENLKFIDASDSEEDICKETSFINEKSDTKMKVSAQVHFVVPSTNISAICNGTIIKECVELGNL